MKNTDINIIEVSPANVEEKGVCCVKNKKAEGFAKKIDWFGSKFNEDLKILLAENDKKKPIAFIEYISAENAWRPVRAENFLFIQCIANYDKKSREQGIVSEMIRLCEEDAASRGKSGVCAMSSKGTWMNGPEIFEKQGYDIVDKSGRFWLMAKKFEKNASDPEFINWESQLSNYQGWNLVYSDQCPWHIKAVEDLSDEAKKQGIDMKITQITTPEQAQNSPTGFGTFGLIRDGRILEDHYISRTRFKNILKKELKK